MTILATLQIVFILHYITLTTYYNTKKTFRSQVITAQKCGNKKEHSKQNDKFAFNTRRFYTTLYHTY